MIIYSIIIILLAMFFSVAMYQLLAILLNTAPFKTSGYIHGITSFVKKKERTIGVITTLSKHIAKYIPLSLAKEIRLEAVLKDNMCSETPKEFQARILLTSVIITVVCFPLAAISIWLLLIPLIIVFIYQKKQKEILTIKSDEKRKLIERDAPQLIQNFAHSIKTNRNVIDVFEAYKSNYDNFLSEQIEILLVGMRSGDQEKALKRFEKKMNHPLISQFIRGVISTKNGENMTLYFEELVRKVDVLRRQRYTQESLKTKPKIATASLLRTMASIVFLFIVCISLISSLLSTIM